MFDFMHRFRSKGRFLCPVCGSKKTIYVANSRLEWWEQQIKSHPEWMQYRGIDPKAGVPVAYSAPGWELPAFDELPQDAEPRDRHVRCDRCRSLLPPTFLDPKDQRVVLITTGMPEAGKTTWLRCLFHPERRKHLVAEPTQQIGRTPYRFIEPYTSSNVDARSSIPYLLYGMTLAFQSRQIAVAGVDIKGEVFRDSATSPDKYHRVSDVLDHLREMRYHRFFLLFVVPFTGRGTAPDIGRLAASLVNNPTRKKAGKKMRQGIIWTHLDRAQCADEPGLRAFVAQLPAAAAIVQAVMSGSNPLIEPTWFEGLSQLTNEVLQYDGWESDFALLETLTWLLFQIMLAYWRVPTHHHSLKVEFYFSFGGGLGKQMVTATSRFAAALFAAWDDNVVHGDFGEMVKEGLNEPDSLQGFRVLPCGLELPEGLDPQKVDIATEGLPVWGDLLLLQMLES